MRSPNTQMIQSRTLEKNGARFGTLTVSDSKEGVRPFEALLRSNVDVDGTNVLITVTKGAVSLKPLIFARYAS